MRKKEAGQAFILVLILLGIGAALVVPALLLSNTHFKTSQIVSRKTNALYAINAAQEWVRWKLGDPSFAETFKTDEPQGFNFDACGVNVTATITMRALEGVGGIILSGDDVIRVTKEVTPTTATKGQNTDFTYIITLEQLSENTTQGLEAIYDVLPSRFGAGAYTPDQDNTKLSLDGGITWQNVPDPLWDHENGYLKWPDNYNWETHEGAFSSNSSSENYFHGIRDFTPRQVKKLKFIVNGRFTSDGVYRNWVALKPWNTLSGATAAITMGDSGNTSHTGMLEVSKVSDPDTIPPFTPMTIEYTITITNMGIPTRQITNITDYLPPGFAYEEDSATKGGGDITIEPLWGAPENINGVERQVLRWTESMFPSGNGTPIQSNETLTLTFEADTSQDVSGLYFNELIVLTDMEDDIRDVFMSFGVSETDFGSNYSWNTGGVTVPAFDAETTAEGENITTNLSFSPEGIIITSWQFE